MPSLNSKPLKLQLRVFLGGQTVAMVMIMCALMIGQLLDTMIVVLSDKVKEWL